MRLIDADALIDDLMERYCKECDKRKGIKNGKRQFIYEIGEAPCRACDVDDAKVELEEAPTIDPVKHGKWEGNFDTSMECSVCGWLFEYYGGLEEEWNYCPHCGARMDL